MSDDRSIDPIQMARFEIDIMQHTNRFEKVPMREAATGRIARQYKAFNTWAEQTPQQRRQSLESGIPWDGVPADIKERMIEEAVRTEPREDHLEPEHPHSRVFYRESERVTLFDGEATERAGILGEVKDRIKDLKAVGFQYYADAEYPRPYPKHEGSVAWDDLAREDKRYVLSEFINWTGVEITAEERIILNVIDGQPEERWMEGVNEREAVNDRLHQNSQEMGQPHMEAEGIANHQGTRLAPSKNHGPTPEQQAKVLGRIAELTGETFHCRDNGFPHPSPGAEEEEYHRDVMSDATGWDTWLGLSGVEKVNVLKYHVDWQGFKEPQRDVVIERVRRGEPKEQWMDGMSTPGPDRSAHKLLQNRERDPLDLARQRAREASSQKSRDRGPEIG